MGLASTAQFTYRHSAPHGIGASVTRTSGSHKTGPLGWRMGLAALRSPFASTSTPRERAYGLFLATVVWLVVLGIGPIVVALVIDLIAMARPGDADGAHSASPLRAVLILAVAIAALVVNYLWVRTFTWPMKTAGELRRHDVAWLAFGSLVVLLRGTTLGDDDLSGWLRTVAGWTAVLLAVAWLVPLLRALAGALRLVPTAWRTTGAASDTNRSA